MRFRSTTSVENTVERYAPLIPAYPTKVTSAATLVTTKARVRGSVASLLGRARAAMPTSSGRTPIPIASAPVAQVACSQIRSLNATVVFRQLTEKALTVAANTNAVPTASVIAPTQSQRDHSDRQRRPASESHASHTRPPPSTTKRMESCVRVSVATPDAAAASATPFQVGLT